VAQTVTVNGVKWTVLRWTYAAGIPQALCRDASGGTAVFTRAEIKDGRSPRKPTKEEQKR